MLGDQATPEIIDAWGDYYNQIAQIFIDVEADMYQAAAWDGFKPFIVRKKEVMTPEIVRFTVDSDDVDKTFTAGQYITVKVKPNYLHDGIEEGDALFLSAPAGDFKVEEDHDKLLFIAGGVGATPVMAMAEEAVSKGQGTGRLHQILQTVTTVKSTSADPCAS